MNVGEQQHFHLMKIFALTTALNILIHKALPVDAFTGTPASFSKISAKHRQISQWRLHIQTERIVSSIDFNPKKKFDKKPYYLGLRPFKQSIPNPNPDTKKKSKSTQEVQITSLSSKGHANSNATMLEKEVRDDHDKTSNHDSLDPNVNMKSSLWNGTKPTNSTNTNVTKNKGKKKSVLPTGSKSSNSTARSGKVVKSSSSLDTLERTIRESFHFLEGFANETYLKGPMQSPQKSTALQSRGSNQTSRSKIKEVRLRPLSSSKPLNVTNLDPSAPLTISDLQRILNQNGYLRRDDMNTIISENPPRSLSRNTTLSSKTKMTKSGVAFPQPSVVSNKHVRLGTMVSSAFFSLLIATSIRPNLWLCGGIVGAVYGADIVEKAEIISNAAPVDGSMMQTTPGGLYGDLALKSGRKLATTYFKVWDFIQGIYFMYRTGQLSYEYYKTYETLDKKFGIQSKMDAWNARFIEGKENFDKWEKENEVGRKVLAGLRTAWLVEENSYKSQMMRKRGRAKSKYRIVRFFVALFDWMKRIFGTLYSTITGNNSDMKEIIKGTRLAIQELNLEVLSQRMGAAVAALVAVNFVGALFAAAPSVLGLLSVFLGIIWPNWFRGTTQRIKEVLEETKARGRGERSMKRLEAQKEKNPRVDMNNFNFYLKDGKKRWYRTGQSFKEDGEKDESQTWLSGLFGFRG